MQTMKNRRSFICIIGLVCVTQFSLASQVSESQQQYIKKYEKQANVLAPAEMLLNTDAEPDLTEGFVSLYNGKDE